MHGFRDENFCKPALSLDQQVDLLIERGLVVPDREKAIHYLRFIGYFRLSGYFHAFYAKGSTCPEYSFIPGTTFRTILDVYIFDRELRLLVMDAVERIEVAFRACISNTMSLRHGPHWFMDPAYFTDPKLHDEFLSKIKKEIERKKPEPFISNYLEKYCHPELPPSWMVVEILSLGTLSRLFSGLADAMDKKMICRPFGMHEVVVRSWLHSMTFLRNLCAHHSTLWNRDFSIKPKSIASLKEHLKRPNTFYAQAVVLCALIRVVADGSKWQDRLAALLKKYSAITPSAMGFPPDWEASPFWGVSSSSQDKTIRAGVIA